MMMSMASILRSAPFTAKLGFTVVAMICLVSLFAPALAPYAEAQVVGGSFEPWSYTSWLGTDSIGRDMLSRMLYGGRNTLAVTISATVLACALGCILGLLTALAGGLTDLLTARLIDVIMALPQLILALLALTVLGTSTTSLIAIIAVLDATRYYRVVRAAAGNIVALDFVEAARLRGEGFAWIALHEVLPNIAGPLLAEVGARFSFIFLFVSSLSFLGLGIQPPFADWGGMARESAALLAFGDITPLIPASAIALLSISMNFIVDWLIDAQTGASS
jgi:peptide/nickel transport system permease protein